ncbi:TPA: hypothetical protein ACXLB5_005081 [Pseudomonas aeruginosa]|nr:hypothetical protein [Pseudomonas tohonis]
MYQVIGLSRTLTLFATLCLGVFLLLHNSDIPALLSGPVPDLWRAVSSSVVFGSVLLYLFGQTPAFAWLCRRTFIGRLFPPIDGEWDISLDSNWGVMQKWLGQGDSSALLTVHGKVRIKSRFFSVTMEFESQDKYSESKTINVFVRPSEQLGLFELNYMFINYTLAPVSTDTNTHNGAARVIVKQADGELFMEGTYFTDRKWTEGLNTAGKVTFTRNSAA